MSVEMLNLLSLTVYCTSCDSAKNCLKVILVGVLRPGVREQGVKGVAGLKKCKKRITGFIGQTKV